jgi:DNA-binding NarL/FixJ family response regulator
MPVSDKQLSLPVRVYLVAENRLLRETLVRLFRKRTEIQIVGDNSCSSYSIEAITSSKAELILLDCFDARPKFDDWLIELQQSTPKIKVVLFGMDEDPDVFLRAVRQGIAGYVLKNASSADLLDAVRAVAQGEAACPAKFCKVLFQTVAASSNEIKDERPTTQFDLTQRQKQLMSLVAMGLSNKEIAAKLNLSQFTIKNHIYRIMKQVDAENRHEAVSLTRDIENVEV